jgi:hypothetical protein
MTSTLFGIDLDTSFSGWLLALFLLLSLGLALFSYRRTNPPLSRVWKSLLTSMRFLTLFLILIALFDLTSRIGYTVQQPPLVAVAIDQSASMGLTDARGARPERIRTALADPVFHTSDHRELRLFRFSDDAAEIPVAKVDSLRFQKDVTDISKTLSSIFQRLATENLQAIVLLTDGNYTRGGNPAREAGQLGIPVYPVGVGSPDPLPDLAIRDVDHNHYAYTDESTPIQVSLTNIGFQRVISRISLTQDDSTVLSRAVTLTPGPSRTDITLDYTPTQPGRHELTLILDAGKQEKSTENNRHTFYINVLKSRLQIALIAGGITSEIGFLRRHLGNSDRYELNVFVETQKGEWLDAETTRNRLQTLDRIDMFILLDFPSENTSPAHLRSVTQSLEQRPRPVLWLAGKRFDPESLAALESVLPFQRLSRGEEQQIHPHLTADGDLHAITQPPAGESGVWNKLPPVFSSATKVVPWPNTTVLATTRPGTVSSEHGLELILIRAHEIKSAAILAHGLWRWDLMMNGLGRKSLFYHQLINNLTRWIETERSEDRVQIETNADRYHLGDPVEILARVYTPALDPTDSADVHIEMIAGTDTRTLSTTVDNRGRYTTTVHPDHGGAYTLIARAEQNGLPIGQDTTRITVGSFEQELAHTHLQHTLLQSMARTSGGRFIPADSVSRLATLLPQEHRVERRWRETELWNHPWLLILIVFLLATEWFVRKRKGLM